MIVVKEFLPLPHMPSARLWEPFPTYGRTQGMSSMCQRTNGWKSHLLTIGEIFARQVKHVFTPLVLEKKRSLMMLSTNCMSRVEWNGPLLPHPSPCRALLSGKIVMPLPRTLRYDHAAHPTWSTQPPASVRGEIHQVIMTSVKLPCGTMCASVLCVQELCFRHLDQSSLLYQIYNTLFCTPDVQNRAKRSRNEEGIEIVPITKDVEQSVQEHL